MAGARSGGSMTWSIKAGPVDNELEIEADLPDRRARFMSAVNITKHRGNALRSGGQVCADAYVTYLSTWDVGMAIEQHRPAARAWLDANGPWYAEPLYDPGKRGKTIVNGKARLILRSRDDALKFKLTFA